MTNALAAMRICFLDLTAQRFVAPDDPSARTVQRSPSAVHQVIISIWSRLMTFFFDEAL